MFTTAAQVRAAMLARLELSALTAKDARLMRLTPLLAAQTAQLHLPAARAGFKIPYFDIAGRPTPFFRFRYLEYTDGTGFAALTALDAEHQLRYAQPVETLPEVYLPPFIDWRAALADAAQLLVITEGELKAACAVRQGIPTLGLGGVWSFRAAGAGYSLLPLLAEVNWRARPVIICFDSDAASNANVDRAQQSLAYELTRRGARPRIALLPALKEDAKTGLDDFIVARGREELLEQVLKTAIPWQPAQELMRMNEEVVLVRAPCVVVELATNNRMSVASFVNELYRPRTYLERREDKTVVRRTAKEWIEWPARAEVQRITYRPGAAHITTDEELNTWQGWACEPRKGNVDPWLRMMDYIFSEATDERQWFERWVAYPLQYPGTKLASAAVIWGRVQGTGKTLIGNTLFRIYGRNAVEISDKDLHGNFNGWAENRQFVMGDEIAGGEKKREIADRMKSMITQREISINQKYLPVYTVPDCINYYFTSNHPDAFFMEDTDRRFFVHQVKGEPRDADFYTQYAAWLNKAGAGALFYYLLNTISVAAFNPQGHALLTASKREMVDLGRSDLGAWVAALRDQPDSLLTVAGAPQPWTLWTTNELLRAYDPAQTGRVTANGLARELSRAGFSKVYKGMPVTTSRGPQKLWAVRGDILHLLNGVSGPWLAALYERERRTEKAVKF